MRAANERLLRKRLADPALGNLNEDQRRAVIVREDRTLIVAGAGTGKIHTMVARARDTVCTEVDLWRDGRHRALGDTRGRHGFPLNGRTTTGG